MAAPLCGAPIDGIATRCPGFVPILFTERGRGLADHLAGTVVLYDDARA